MPTPEELLAALAETGEAYARFIESLTPEAFRRRPAADAWTTAEITGHVIESPVTFAGQMSRVAASPGAPIGRPLDDPGRLGALAAIGDASPAEAAARVRAGVDAALAILRAIPPEGWQAAGTHPTLGAVAVTAMVERNIVNHLRDHLEQARAAAGA